MKTIRNKRTGEVRQVPDNEVAKFVPTAKCGGMISKPSKRMTPRMWGGGMAGMQITQQGADRATAGARAAAGYKPKPIGESSTGNIGDFAGAANLLSKFAAGPADNEIQPGQTYVNSGESTGSSVLKGTGQGAAIGTSFVPGWGTLIGGVIGAGVGLVGGLGERSREREEYRQLESLQRKKYQDREFDPNMDPYGAQGSYYAQEGMQVPDEGEEAPQSPEQGQQQQQMPQQPQKTPVDVELGELLIDPMTLDIIREYDNPNKFSRHAKNPQKEPVGNFTQIEPGNVVISRKYAKTYKKGDNLTRKSIMMEIMKNQRNNPEEMVPAPGSDEAEYAQKGKRIGWNDFSGSSTGIDTIMPKKPANYGPISWDDFSGSSIGPDTELPGSLTGSTNSIFSLDAIPDYGQPSDFEYDPPQPPVGKNKFRITPTDIARAANFVSTGYGLATAGKFEPEVYDDNTGFNDANTYLQNLETNPSIEAARTNMATMAANRNKYLSNINSPSTRAEAASSFSDVLGKTGELIQNATNTAMDNRNKKRGALAEMKIKQGEVRLAGRTKLRENIQMNRATSRSLTQKALAEGATNFGAQVMDDNRIRSINTALQFAQIRSDGTMEDTKAYYDAALDIMESGVNMTDSNIQRQYEQNKAAKRNGTYVPPAERKASNSRGKSKKK